MGPDQHHLQPISALLGAYEWRLASIRTYVVIQQRLWAGLGTQICLSEEARQTSQQALLIEKRHIRKVAQQWCMLWVFS